MPPKKSARKKKPKKLEEKFPQDFGVYKLGNQLGKGAFGSVYQGFDTTTGALVAIKAIPLAKGSDNPEVQSEIDMMSHLDNEYIVKYIGSHQTKDFLYIVMEYAEGGSVQHLQKKFSNYNNEILASQYIHQVLLGLKYLHSQSIIHRDIKAANILLNNNVAKLSDFGISVNISQGSQAVADFQCSPYWAAPEVINMESITEKCDIWSLGITAIEMFTGEPPYFDLAPIPAMFKIVQNKETPLPENISDDFKDFLLGCLNRKVAFRKSTEELLKHNWITRANMKQEPKQQQADDGTKADSKQSTGKLETLDEFAESNSDDDMIFDGGGPLQGEAENLDDFAESDDFDDFDEAFGADSGSLQIKLVSPKTKHASFSSSGPSSAPDIDKIVDELLEDETPMQKEKERKNTLMKNVIAMMDKLSGNELDYDLLSGSFKNIEALNETNIQNQNKQIIETCNTLLKHFTDEDFLRKNLTAYHGVIPIVEIIQTRNMFLLEHALKFILVASNFQVQTLNMMCLLGVLPYLFDYCIEEEYSTYENVQIMSLQLLHNICETKERPLQMFISAGGLTKMAKILEVNPYKEKPIITGLVIEMVASVFTFKSSTPKSCFSRILTQTKLIELLGERYVELPQNDPMMPILCQIFEYFSNADLQVRKKMANKTFIDNIFIKARKKTSTNDDASVSLLPVKPKKDRRKRKISSNEDILSVSDKSENSKLTIDVENAPTDQLNDDSLHIINPPKEIPQIAEGLSNPDLYTIMTAINNIAMEKNIVTTLWQTDLINYLLDYMKVSDDFQLNPIITTCFSAIFHLSRVLESHNTSKIVRLIPMLKFIIYRNTQLKELATTIFLDFVNSLETNDEDHMRTKLEENDGLEILFKLLKEYPHKEQIISQYNNWANVSPQTVENSLISHLDEFVKIVINVFIQYPIDIKNIFADKLLLICYKCTKFCRQLCHTDLLPRIMALLVSSKVRNAPELKKSLLSMLLVFYKTEKNPKKLIVTYRIDKIGKRLERDQSIPVQLLAKQLLQSVSSNYIL